MPRTLPSIEPPGACFPRIEYLRFREHGRFEGSEHPRGNFRDDEQQQSHDRDDRHVPGVWLDHAFKLRSAQVMQRSVCGRAASRGGSISSPQTTQVV